MVQAFSFIFMKSRNIFISDGFLKNLLICRRNFSSNFTKNNSVKLSYVSYGIEEMMNTPIIIMHGLFGSKNNWNTLSKSLHGQTKRKVIAVDARNHGNSPHSSTMTYSSMAEDVRDLLKSLNIEKSVLMGHSMGGAVMMCTALNYPNLVEKLVIVDMSPVKTSPSLRQMTEIIDILQSIEFKNGNSLSEVRKQCDKFLSKSINSVLLRQFLLMNVIEKSAGEFGWRMNLPIIAKNFENQIAVFPQIIPQLANQSFNKHTLFLAGSKSDYIKRDDHENIKKIFSRAEIEYIEGAGHWVQSEKPVEFLNATVKFINS